MTTGKHAAEYLRTGIELFRFVHLNHYPVELVIVSFHIGGIGTAYYNAAHSPHSAGTTHDHHIGRGFRYKLRVHQSPVLKPQKHGLDRYVNIVVVNIYSLFLKTGKTDIRFLKNTYYLEPYSVEFDILTQGIDLAEELRPDVGPDNADLNTIFFLVFIENRTVDKRQVVKVKIIIRHSDQLCSVFYPVHHGNRVK